MCVCTAVISPSSFHQTEAYSSAESENCSWLLDPLTLLTFKAADLLMFEGSAASQSKAKEPRLISFLALLLKIRMQSERHSSGPQLRHVFHLP